MEILKRVMQALLLLSGTTNLFADDISVPNTFTADTTISSSQMNANFDALVQESNQNDARIESVEGDVAALNQAANGNTYTWLGYTTDTFSIAADNYATWLNLTAFCKAEFGATAMVGSIESLEYVAKNDSSFTAPTTARALFSPDGNNWIEMGNVGIANPFWGVTAGSASQLGYCSITSSGLVTCYAAGNFDTAPVACVTAN